MKTYRFALDHFGIVSSSLIQDLIKQTGDKRTRKIALNTLTRMARATKQIPKDTEVVGGGLWTDSAGQIWLAFETTEGEQR